MMCRAIVEMWLQSLQCIVELQRSAQLHSPSGGVGRCVPLSSLDKSGVPVICAPDFAGACALLLCAVSPSVRAAIHRALLTINTPARTARSISHICTWLCSIISFLYRKNNRRGLVLVCDWHLSKKTGSLACNVDTTHAHTFLKYVDAFQ